MKSALRDSGLKVTFRSMVATPDNFAEMLSRKPRILNIACHSIRKEPGSSLVIDIDDVKFLVFETVTGEATLISANEI